MQGRHQPVARDTIITAAVVLMVIVLGIAEGIGGSRMGWIHGQADWLYNRLSGLPSHLSGLPSVSVTNRSQLQTPADAW